MSHEKQARARQRLEKILAVQSGQITATEAARQLGVSRKTYYQWEKRALTGMLEALAEADPGRPPQPPDPEAEALRAQTLELEKKVKQMEQTLELRSLLSAPDKKKVPKVRWR